MPEPEITKQLILDAYDKTDLIPIPYKIYAKDHEGRSCGCGLGALMFADRPHLLHAGMHVQERNAWVDKMGLMWMDVLAIEAGFDRGISGGTVDERLIESMHDAAFECVYHEAYEAGIAMIPKRHPDWLLV